MNGRRNRKKNRNVAKYSRQKKHKCAGTGSVAYFGHRALGLLTTAKFFFQQWIALVTTPKGWKMPEKSKIKFKNVGPPAKRLQYSYCEVRYCRTLITTDSGNRAK